jgi:hypothetical protein
MITASEEKVARFNFQERAIHWLAALSFLYAAFTGLALWSPRLFWLASMFGGGNTVRGWHPWGLGFMFRNWAGQMRLDADDRAWLRQAHRYAMHDEEDYLRPALQCRAEDTVLDSVRLHAVSVSQWSGSLVSGSHATFAAVVGRFNSSFRCHPIHSRYHRSHLHGHSSSSRSLSRHDSRMGTPQLGSVAPPEVVPRD